MTPMTVRGVPRGLQRDAWWMAPDAQTGIGSGTVVPKTYRLPILIALVVVADFLVMRSDVGLGFVALILTLATAVHWTLRTTVARVTAIKAWALLAASLVPAFDLFQFTSFVIAWGGLMVFAAMMSGDRIGAAVRRLPFYGVSQTWRDVWSARVNGPDRSSLTDWILPLGVGGVFAALFAAANPLVTTWLGGFNFDHLPSPWRVVVWAFVAIVFWPLLRLSVMGLHKPVARARVTVKRVGVLNARSVTRALIMFNLLFAAQTLMDVGFLWGGVRLPDGLSYAQYAHRGAYPLMITALLAGGFALIAQPWLDGRGMRALLLAWVVQNLVLVMSSILRLDLYIDAYGMTHLRFAAVVWMVVVALGLGVLVMQIIGRKEAIWMLQRAFGIGVFAVYMSSLTNVAGYVARHQLTHTPLDAGYVCQLNEGAAVAVAQLQPDLCDNRYTGPTLSVPNDLREWGFRNMRLRHSLAATKAGAEV